MSVRTIVLAMFLTCLLSDFTVAEGKKVSTPIEKGRVIYKKHCASCHGVRGKGDGVVAGALKTRPSDLSTISKRAGGAFPFEKVIAIIDGRKITAAHGTREMPVWGARLAMNTGIDAMSDELRHGELSGLIDYLKSLQVN